MPPWGASLALHGTRGIGHLQDQVGSLTAVRLIVVEAKSVSKTVRSGHSEGSSRDKIQDEGRAQAFNIRNILNIIDPSFMYFVKTLGIRLDSVMAILNAKDNVRRVS